MITIMAYYFVINEEILRIFNGVDDFCWFAGYLLSCLNNYSNLTRILYGQIMCEQMNKLIFDLVLIFFKKAQNSVLLLRNDFFHFVLIFII